MMIKNSIFPAGLIVDEPSLDIEHLVELHRAKKWDVQGMQLEKGNLFVSLLSVFTPNLQLAYNSYSLGSLRKGSVPAGTVLLTYLGGESEIFQNSRLTKHELLFIQDDDELDIISNTKSDAHFILVNKELLATLFYNYFSKTVDEALKDKHLLIRSEKIEYFTKGLIRWINYLTSAEFVALEQKPYAEIEMAIISHVFSCIDLVVPPKERKKFQVKKIRDLLHQNICTKVSIAELVKQLDVSERQLHDAFQSTYGISPKKYLQNLRFNSVKKELLLADPKQHNIADIAHKFGFTHMSFFSSEYKKMFNELPSTTFHKF